MIIMPKGFKIGDAKEFSQIISLEDENKSASKNIPSEHLSTSIMVDVLLMLLCERSNSNPSLNDSDINSD